MWWWFCWAALAAGIDLNTATAADLETLPGIGAAKAQAIVDWRSRNGPFTTLDQLDDVPGIGPATIAAMRPAVTLSGAQPPAPPAPGTPAPPTATATARVNINTATLEEIGALPGVGPTKAEAIVGDRDVHGPFSSCQDLTRVTGIGPATVASIGDRCTTSGD